MSESTFGDVLIDEAFWAWSEMFALFFIHNNALKDKLRQENNRAKAEKDPWPNEDLALARRIYPYYEQTETERTLAEQIETYKRWKQQLEEMGKETEPVSKAQIGDAVLILKTGIAGLRYHLPPEADDTRDILDSLHPGKALRLERESTNPADEWAIAVYTEYDGREVMLGYVTRYKNEPLARLMDSGKKLCAFVDVGAVPFERDEGDDGEPFALILRKAPKEDYTVPFSVYMLP